MLVVEVEYNRIADLLDEYFQEVRRYNRMLGAFQMTAEDLAEAAQKEALSYRRIQAVKTKLQQNGIPV